MGVVSNGCRSLGIPIITLCFQPAMADVPQCDYDFFRAVQAEFSQLCKQEPFISDPQTKKFAQSPSLGICWIKCGVVPSDSANASVSLTPSSRHPKQCKKAHCSQHGKQIVEICKSLWGSDRHGKPILIGADEENFCICTC